MPDPSPHIRLDDVDDLATRIQGRGWGLDDPKGERQAALDALLALLDEESTAAQANYNRAVVAEAQAKNLEEQLEANEKWMEGARGCIEQLETLREAAEHAESELSIGKGDEYCAYALGILRKALSNPASSLPPKPSYQPRYSGLSAPLSNQEKKPE